jgi:hypothetical protein
MNASLAAPAGEKEILLARTAQCRMRLHGEAQDLRDSLNWKRAVIAAATAPSARRIAFGLALSLAGLGRATRMVMFAGRVVLFARIAGSAIDLARRLAGPSPRAGAQDAPMCETAPTGPGSSD